MLLSLMWVVVGGWLQLVSGFVPPSPGAGFVFRRRGADSDSVHRREVKLPNPVDDGVSVTPLTDTGGREKSVAALQAMHLATELKSEFSRYRYYHHRCYQCCYATKCYY